MTLAWQQIFMVCYFAISAWSMHAQWSKSRESPPVRHGALLIGLTLLWALPIYALHSAGFWIAR